MANVFKEGQQMTVSASLALGDYEKNIRLPTAL